MKTIVETLPSRVRLAAGLLVLAVALTLTPGPVSADETAAFAKALRLARDGRRTEARVAAQAVVANDPGDVRAARLLQDLLLAMGKPKDALAAIPAGAPALVKRGLHARLRAGEAASTELAALLKEDGAPARFRLDLATAQIAAGRAPAAEASANTFLKAYPDDCEGLTILGAALVARGRRTPARKAFERALEIAPGLAEPAAALAALHAAAKHEEKSRAVLQAALAIHPDHPTLLRAFADSQARAGEYDDAVGTLGKVLRMPVPAADVHARLSEIHRARRDYPAAGASAAAALAMQADHPRALRTRGFVHMKDKKYAEALADYSAAAKGRPTWAPIHVDIAFVHFLMGKVIPAQKAIDLALKLDKSLIDAHMKAGLILFARGKGKQAKKALAIVLKDDDDHVAAHRTLGYILLDEGKAKSARKHFLAIAELNEDDSASMRMVGRCELAMGKVEDAVASFRNAVSRNGEDAFAYFDLGKGLERLEKWDDAAAAYTRAISTEPTFTYPHIYLARLLDEVQDEPDQALPHYKRYLELDGEDRGDVIKKRVETLEKK